MPHMANSPDHPALDTSPENRRRLAKHRIILLARRTREELHVEKLLDQMGERYLAQKGFLTVIGHIIVDFYLPKRRKLCLEIDGPYHERQKLQDEKRDQFLTRVRGFRVIRLTNETALALDVRGLSRVISTGP